MQPNPPRSVDNVYNHICDSAAPPIKTAGPKLRAGFNDTSVIVPPITIRATKIKPIISPAKCESPFFPVVTRITKTKIKVKQVQS